MPARMIREGILDSRAICSMSDSGQLFYRCLLNVVDDFGRFEFDLDLIRTKCFWRQIDRWPLERVRQALTECVACLTDDGHATVRMYMSNKTGKKYIAINNFDQRLRLKVEKYPDPDSEECSDCLTDDGHVSVMLRQKEEKRREEAEEKFSPAEAGEKESVAGVSESDLRTVEKQIHQRHPAIRRCGVAEIRKNLLAILRKEPKAERGAVLRKINDNHAAMCATDGWTKEDGQFSKGLDNWLAPTKMRWAESPDTIPSNPAGNQSHPVLLNNFDDVFDEEKFIKFQEAHNPNWKKLC